MPSCQWTNHSACEFAWIDRLSESNHSKKSLFSSASDSHKLEWGEKKKKELSFPPLIHTQTTQELVIFEKIASKTRLIYDEGKKKKKATATSQTAGRYKDVSHRRAWHIRMTATSSLVLSERGEKKQPKKQSVWAKFANSDQKSWWWKRRGESLAEDVGALPQLRGVRH